MFDRDSHFVQIDGRRTVPDRVRTVCGLADATDYGALIKEQDAFVDSVKRRDAPAAAWLGLACRRALLFAMGAPGREGPLMAAGTSWVSAAVDNVAEALRREPGNVRAAQLLATIAFEVVPGRNPAATEQESDRPTSGATAPPSIVARLASLIYRAVQLGVRDPGVFRACTSLMLDAGDATAGHDCSERALAAGSDSTWHLLRLTWLAVLHADTASATRLFAAAEQAAHDPTARAELGWHFESPCQPNDACTPVGLLGFRLPATDKVRWLSLPDSVATEWFAARLADAARGDTTAYWRGERGSYTQSVPPLRGSQAWSVLVRHLVAHFSSVSYAGATFRACLVTTVPALSCASAIEPYDATTIDVIAQVDHLWDPVTGDPIDLVPYTIVGNDLALSDTAGGRTASMELDLRRWGGAGARDTIVHLELVLPAHGKKHPAFTGYLVVSTLRGLNAWSLMATQAELRHGGVYQDDKPPLDSGSLVLSDLVLGTASQKLAWDTPDRQIALAPQGVVARSEPVQLYFELKSDIDRPSVRTTITLFPEGVDRATARPAMQIGFTGPIQRGLNEVDRELVLSRLVSGRYWFDVEVADPLEHVRSRRSVLMYLK